MLGEFVDRRLEPQTTTRAAAFKEEWVGGKARVTIESMRNIYCERV